MYHLKKAGETHTIEATERMRWGKRLEGPIAEGVAEELGVQAAPFKHYMRIPEIRMGASFDYEITSGEYAGWLMEIKNVDRLIFKRDWEESEATDYIETQVQHQMHVADRPGCLIVALVGGNEAFYIPRKRDVLIGTALEKRVKRFWDDVLAGSEPEPNYNKDADFIIGLHQSAGSSVLDGNDDPRLAELIKSYQTIKADISANEKEAKALKAQVLDIAGDGYNKIIVDGYSVSCGMVKDTPPTVITSEMVGQTYGGRNGFRNFRVTKKKEK